MQHSIDNGCSWREVAKCMPKQWKTWKIFKTEMYTKKHKYNEDKFVTVHMMI